MKKYFFVILFAFLIMLPSFAMADLNDGLVAYYSFNNCDATDDSGNGLDGTIYGNPECVDGVVGKALEFDGVDDYIDFDATSMPSGASERTISAWVKIKDINSENSVIGWGRDDTRQLSEIKLEPGSYFTFHTYGSQDKKCSLKLIEEKWYNLIVIYDKDYVKLYVDGNKCIEESIGVINTPNINGRIGAFPDPFTKGWDKSYFDGDVDDIRIYNRALSESEIQELYNYKGDSSCSSSEYTESDLQAKYNEGYEAGKKYCQEHPSECGMSCEGTTTTSTSCDASFNMFTNTMHIPCLNMGDSYWLDLGLINSNPVQLELTDFGKN